MKGRRHRSHHTAQGPVSTSRGHLSPSSSEPVLSYQSASPSAASLTTLLRSPACQQTRRKTQVEPCSRALSGKQCPNKPAVICRAGSINQAESWARASDSTGGWRGTECF
ncbi:unnamed protein product [Pleuronectes platessa]|uniref:Uncharacterized protein n=1 Tax=Pleuronectes platessa TaxID=8262 RepID=A0A9N7W1B1_PLEPL|nr:unnamed protein product [Pleuronectes platessa]